MRNLWVRKNSWLVPRKKVKRLTEPRTWPAVAAD